MKKPIPFGKYLLLDRINVGGMAEVFVAKAFGVEGFERLLAIKKILPTMVEDQEFITMFIDEARIAVHLNHSNIVQIFELGKHDENYYIAMEYVSGKDLRAILDRHKKNGDLMPLPMAVFIAAKICEGLDYAHRKKDTRGQELHIVHRDVSPQNILLSFEGELKIIDFGIAKAANRAQKTQAGILKGKFGYMSPEQVRGLPIDRRSDVFAVGVILYEILTGEKLFVGESDFSTLEKVRNAEVLPPSRYNEEIPEGLERVVLKALARDVEDRYQWASELQEDLMRYLVIDGHTFNAKSLSRFMREAFAEDLRKEVDRIQRFSRIDREQGEQAGVITDAGVRSSDTGSVSGAYPVKDRTQIYAVSFEESVIPSKLDTREIPHMGEELDRSDGDRTGPHSNGGLPFEDDDSGGGLEETPGSYGGSISSADLGPVDQPTMIKSEQALAKTRADRAGERNSIQSSGVMPRTKAGSPQGRPSSARLSRSDKIQRSVQGWVKKNKAASVGAVAFLGLLIGISMAMFVTVSQPEAGPVAQGGTGTLFIYPNPREGSTIELDGKVVESGKMYINNQVPAGRHQITVRWPNEPSREEEVMVTAGGMHNVSMSPPDGQRLAAPLPAKRDAPARPAPAPPSQPAPEEKVPTPAPIPEPAVVPPMEAAAPDPVPKPAADSGPAKDSPILSLQKPAEPPAPEPAPPPPPPPPKKSYVLLIDSDPSRADVFIDGRRMGQTPYTMDRNVNPEKAYKVRLALKNHLTADRVVRFQPDRDRESLFVQLEAKKRPPPRQVRADRPRRERPDRDRTERERPRVDTGEQPNPLDVASIEDPEPAPPPPRPRPSGSVGKLMATTNPVASIWIDGEDSGRTTPTFQPIELSPGEHTVEFRAPDGRKAVKRVSIRAGETEKLLKVELE
jgi:serine/threonine protein kinase